MVRNISRTNGVVTMGGAGCTMATGICEHTRCWRGGGGAGGRTRIAVEAGEAYGTYVTYLVRIASSLCTMATGIYEHAPALHMLYHSVCCTQSATQHDPLKRRFRRCGPSRVGKRDSCLSACE